MVTGKRSFLGKIFIAKEAVERQSLFTEKCICHIRLTKEYVLKNLQLTIDIRHTSVSHYDNFSDY